jgi:hypothetical protein
VSSLASIALSMSNGPPHGNGENAPRQLGVSRPRRCDGRSSRQFGYVDVVAH